MTKRERALNFPGDRTQQFHFGQAMGPGQDGFYRRVTAVTYCDDTDTTRVAVEVVEVAGEGERLRYFGNDLGTGQLPPDRAPLNEEITPR